MKKIIFPLLLISASLSAQTEKELKQLIPKIDTVKMQKADFGKNSISPIDQQKNRYKMPYSKPKEGYEYSSLKDKKTDLHYYKMLNSITPEQPKKEGSIQPLPENK